MSEKEPSKYSQLSESAKESRRKAARKSYHARKNTEAYREQRKNYAPRRAELRRADYTLERLKNPKRRLYQKFAFDDDPTLTEQQKARKRIYHSDPEKAKAESIRWRNENIEFARRRDIEHTRKLKTAVVWAYGSGYCACCGEDQLEFLTIDHINGDGGEFRKKHNLTGKRFYQYLKNNGFPFKGELQVLCCNCNFAKRSDGMCPHQVRVTKMLRIGAA